MEIKKINLLRNRGGGTLKKANQILYLLSEFDQGQLKQQCMITKIKGKIKDMKQYRV